MASFKADFIALFACACFIFAAAQNGTEVSTKIPVTEKVVIMTTSDVHSTKIIANPTKERPHTESPHPSNSSGPKCEGRSGCDECTKDSHCYWCEATKKCAFYQVNKIVPRDCPDHKWKWKQCVISGMVLIIAIPTAVGLFLLTCGCCIYCKCCRGKNKKSWKKAEERLKQRRIEMEQKHESRRKERQARQDAIRQKYGLLKDEDEEPLI